MQSAKLARRQRRIVTGLALLSILASFVVAGPVLKASGFYGCIDELWPVESVKVDDRYRVRTRTRLGPVARQARRFASGWERAAPLCCAVWVVLGPGRGPVRAAGAMACLAALACLATHRAADDALGLYFGVFTLYAVLLIGLRRITGWRLGHPVDGVETSGGSNTGLGPQRSSAATLGLADLFVVTACFAVFAAAVQLAIPWDRLPIGELVWRLWRHLSSRVVWGHDAIYLAPALVAGLTILGRRRRVWLVLASLVAAALVTPLVSETLAWATARNPTIRRIAWERLPLDRLLPLKIAISLGFVAGACFAAWVLRNAGFRLVGPEGNGADLTPDRSSAAEANSPIDKNARCVSNTS